MPLETRPLHELFGAEVAGIDVRAVDASTVAEIARVSGSDPDRRRAGRVQPALRTGDARALLRELLEAATRPELVYTHRWAVGDLVMWDNRCTLHRGRPWDESRYRRVMHRTTVAGDGPTAPDLADLVISPAREGDIAWGRAQLALV